MVTTYTFVKPLLTLSSVLMVLVSAHLVSASAETTPSANISPEAQTKLNKELVYNAFFGNAEKVLSLVAEGANPNATNDKGVPALSLAAQRKSEVGYEVVKSLLASRADINGRDSNGQTPLFYAARVNNLNTVMTLLENGADYYMADNSGNIARNIAYSQGHQEVFDAMDKFVNDKREAVLQQYADKEAKLKELLATKAAAPDKKATSNAPATTSTTIEVPLDVEKSAFNSTVYDLSFHTCAYQYWFYVKSVSLKTALKPSQMLQLMDEHKSKADKASETLVKEYGTNRSYALRIIEPSKSNIKKQLDKMGSNITRKSNGVGDETDALKRCSDIADSWVVYAPEMPTKTKVVTTTPPSSPDDVSASPEIPESSANPAKLPPSDPADEAGKMGDKSPPQESL